MRIVLVLISVTCLTLMGACGEEEGGGGEELELQPADVLLQQTRFYQLVCTCSLPPAQQGMVVSPGAACVSDYVGGAETRDCKQVSLEAAWPDVSTEAECFRAAYEDAENCLTRAPGCDRLGECIEAVFSAVGECGTAVDDATKDC